MIRCLMHLSCEDKLRQLVLFSLQKARLQENLTAAFQYLTDDYRKGGERLFTRTGSDGTRGNGFKLKQGRFRLDARRKFFIFTGSEALEQLPRAFVDVHSLKMVNDRLNTALNNLV